MKHVSISLYKFVKIISFGIQEQA